MLSSVGYSQSSIEYAGIIETLNNYLDGGTNNDFDQLAQAFHPAAMMKYVGSEGYMEVNALDYFKKAMKPGPAQNRKTTIQAITVTGNLANAQLEIKYETFRFIDSMNLLKIEGEWKIVNKIFYKETI